MTAEDAPAATYYVRGDGGTSGQCTGREDAPYPGNGTGQPCALAHPFWALDGEGHWTIGAGDTLLVHPGSYMMGFGAPNSSWCSSDYPWECRLPPLPSGVSDTLPTRLLGVGWNSGCQNPPELWGTERADSIISLNGTSHAEIACLEITDHSGCVESHANPAIECQREDHPFGNWAYAGITASDSSDVLLRHLDIHGLAGVGIHGGRLTDWTMEHVRIAANGWAGWDGDIEDADADSGIMAFRNCTIEWNGCAETWPEDTVNNCWAQTAGGYGDGLGTGRTGGTWIVEDSLFRYNTSDGLDLLYVREPGSSITIRRTQAYGNAGDQFKLNGQAAIENSLAVSNCGYFEGKPFTFHVDNCRAGGSALVIVLRQGTPASVVNCTLAGQGDCLAIVECDDTSCDGSETVTLQNNVFQGYGEFGTPGETTCGIWFDQEGFYSVRSDYNVFFNLSEGTYPAAPHTLTSNPLFADSTLDTLDPRLQAGSPAQGSGLAPGTLGGLVPYDDIQHAPRPIGGPGDRGAYATSREQGVCADLRQDLSLAVPCADYAGVLLSFDLIFDTDHPADSGGPVWRLDWGSLHWVEAVANGTCLPLEATLDLNLSCVNYGGFSFTGSLLRLPISADPTGLLWELDTDSVSLR